MQFSTLALTLLSLSFAAALPLNINLGAYSPALVVGDGALSFGEATKTAAATTAQAPAAQGQTEGGATITPAAEG